MNEVRTLDEVADNTSVIGNLVGDAVSRVKIQRRNCSVGGRSDTADALHYMLSIKGVTSS